MMSTPSELSQDEVARLFALDESLRAEADRMLAESGLGAILDDAGYAAVGSYAMKTMTWRDLDFERTQDPPDWEQHWALGARLAKTGWMWKSSCVDGYRDPRQAAGIGSLYWGLRAADPQGGPTWKLDLHTARAEDFAPGLAQRDEWMALLTDDARAHILAIKEAVCHSPEYRDTMISVHIYDAVLDHGVRGIEAFREWWRPRYGREPGWREKDGRVTDPGAWVRNP